MHLQSAGSCHSTSRISCSGNPPCKESHTRLASSSRCHESPSPTMALTSSPTFYKVATLLRSGQRNWENMIENPTSARYVAPVGICRAHSLIAFLSGSWSPPRSSRCSKTMLRFQKPQRHGGEAQLWLELHWADAWSIWFRKWPRFFQRVRPTLFLAQDRCSRCRCHLDQRYNQNKLHGSNLLLLFPFYLCWTWFAVWNKKKKQFHKP